MFINSRKINWDNEKIARELRELVPEANVEDYVMVHVGAAISIVDEEGAQKTFDLLKQLGELNDLEDGP